MPESNPTGSQKSGSGNFAQESPRRRRSKRGFVLLAVVGSIIFWQRHLVIGLPLQAAVNHAIRSRDLVKADWWIGVARKILPSDSRFPLLRAKVARRRGDMQQVSDAVKVAAELGASRDELNREQLLALAQSGQLRRAEPHMARLLTDQNHDNKEVCEAYVIGFIRNNRTDSALQLLDPWITDATADATPLVLRARIYRLLSVPQKAEQDFRKAMEREPEWIEPELELAELLVEQKRYSEAAVHFEKMTEQNQYPVRANIGLAECRLAEGEPQLAVSLLQDACRHDDESLDAHVALGRALLETGQYPGSIDALKRALQLRPGYDETHYLLAQAYSLSNQRSLADEHFEFVATARAALEELDKLNAALLQNSADPVGLFRAGEIQLQYGDPQEGIVRILAALDLDPDNKAALRSLADYYDRKANSSDRYQQLADQYRQRLSEATKR